MTSATPNGREIKEADLNVNLTKLTELTEELTGFRNDNGLGNTHTRTLAWYAGTLDLGLEKLKLGRSSITPPASYKPEEQPIYDALGSNALLGMNVDVKSKFGDTWYHNNFSNEGVGEGWYFSITGGGKDKRLPISSKPRIDLKKDNTETTRQRGDFAVPTLFDGNFDAITQPNGSQLIPGWTGLSQTALVDINTIPGLEDYRSKLNITQPNYAIELDPGTSITHNDFVLPEWGSLRFNVFAPTPADDSDFNSVIKVWLTDDNASYELKNPSNCIQYKTNRRSELPWRYH